MSLNDVAQHRVFASVTAQTDLVRHYVPSHELSGVGGADRPEAKIVNALASSAPPQRLHIYGEAGAGKTSLILRALADIARRETLQRPVHPMFVNTGDAPSQLTDPQHFMQMLLGLIQVNGSAFATVDPVALRDATAEQTTYTPTTVAHQAGITTPFFSYQPTLSQAFATQTIGVDPARVRNDFQDVLRTVTKDYRAVIVIDDTDHFAASGPDGKLDVEAISNLYHHGVRTLADFDELDVIVAIQPHFQQVEPVTDVERRYNFEAVHVATLAADKDELTLSLVLGRRLRNANITATVDDLIHPQALARPPRRVLHSKPRLPARTRMRRRSRPPGRRRRRRPDRTTARAARARATLSGRLPRIAQLGRHWTRASSIYETLGSPCADLPRLFNPSTSRTTCCSTHTPIQSRIAAANSAAPGCVWLGATTAPRTPANIKSSPRPQITGPRPRNTTFLYTKTSQTPLAMRPTISPRAQPSIG